MEENLDGTCAERERYVEGCVGGKNAGKESKE